MILKTRLAHFTLSQILKKEIKIRKRKVAMNSAIPALQKDHEESSPGSKNGAGGGSL
jgi:hypothetical protein